MGTVFGASLLFLVACSKSTPPKAPASEPMRAMSATSFIPNDPSKEAIHIDTVTDPTSGSTVVAANSLPRNRRGTKPASPPPTRAEVDRLAQQMEPAISKAEAQHRAALPSQQDVLDAAVQMEPLLQTAEAENKLKTDYARALARLARYNSPKAQLARAEKSFRILIPGNLVFEVNDFTFSPGPGTEAVMNEVLELLLDNPKITMLRVEGHTDSTGSAPDNLALSGLRALTVKRWLVSRGIPASRVMATGFGDEEPIATNFTGPGRAQNRRVEFYVAGWEGQPLQKDLSGGGTLFGLSDVRE